MYMYNVYVMYRYSVCNVYVRLGSVPVQSGECVCVHNLHVDSWLNNFAIPKYLLVKADFTFGVDATYRWNQDAYT